MKSKRSRSCDRDLVVLRGATIRGWSASCGVYAGARSSLGGNCHTDVSGSSPLPSWLGSPLAEFPLSSAFRALPPRGSGGASKTGIRGLCTGSGHRSHGLNDRCTSAVSFFGRWVEGTYGYTLYTNCIFCQVYSFS